MLLLPMLDDYPLQPRGATADRSIARAPRPAVLMAMAAVFLYQAGEMAAFAFMIELGRHHRLDADFIGLAVAVSLWIGGPAALLVAWWSTRSGRLLPVGAGIVLMAAVLALLLIADAIAYFVANAVGFGVFFSMTIPYLLGVASEMDNTGRLAAVAGFVSAAGLATGPAVAGSLSANGNFDAIVLFSVVSLLASAALVTHPARVLDRLNPHGRVVW
jgi:MFS family permease